MPRVITTSGMRPSFFEDAAADQGPSVDSDVRCRGRDRRSRNVANRPPAPSRRRSRDAPARNCAPRARRTSGRRGCRAPGCRPPSECDEVRGQIGHATGRPSRRRSGRRTPGRSGRRASRWPTPSWTAAHESESMPYPMPCSRMHRRAAAAAAPDRQPAPTDLDPVDLPVRRHGGLTADLARAARVRVARPSMNVPACTMARAPATGAASRSASAPTPAPAPAGAMACTAPPVRASSTGRVRNTKTRSVATRTRSFPRDVHVPPISRSAVTAPVSLTRSNARTANREMIMEEPCSDHDRETTRNDLPLPSARGPSSGSGSWCSLAR